MSRVTSAGPTDCEQFEQTWHTHFRQRAITDILTWVCLLVHLGAHIAWINPVDTPCRIFGGENVRKLFERCFARSIATPTLICLHTRVAGDVDDARARFQEMLHCLDKRQGSNNVGAVHSLEHFKRVVQQRRLRARPKNAGAVDKGVKTTQLSRCIGESTTVSRIGDITGYSNDSRLICKEYVGGFERPGSASVDDELPALRGKLAG